MASHEAKKENLKRASEEHQEKEAIERQSLSAVTVYHTVRIEGEEELSRPIKSLWWSGIAAGIGISTSVYTMGLLRAQLPDTSWRPLIEAMGYSFGFIIVILSRLQLFTENTITVVLPVLNEGDRKTFLRAARLWSVVLVANLVGTALTVWISVLFEPTSPEHLDGMIAVSRHYAELAGFPSLAAGIPAGFFIAAIVWMLPASQGFEIFTIFVFTFLISAGGLTHVIAGSTEIFLLVAVGELSLWSGITDLFLPTLAGNVIGGTGLFALLAYAQVSAEV